MKEINKYWLLKGVYSVILFQNPVWAKFFDKEWTFLQRQKFQFSRLLVKSIYYGTESFSFFVPEVWDVPSNSWKNIGGTDKFKQTTKKWKSKYFPCRICNKFNANVSSTFKKMLALFSNQILITSLSFCLPRSSVLFREIQN